MSSISSTHELNIVMSLYQIVKCSERTNGQISYRLKYGIEKLALLRNLTFLIRRRDNHIIPNGIQVSLPTKLHNRKKSEQMTSTASKALLQCCHQKIFKEGWSDVSTINMRLLFIIDIKKYFFQRKWQHTLILYTYVVQKSVSISIKFSVFDFFASPTRWLLDQN